MSCVNAKLGNEFLEAAAKSYKRKLVEDDRMSELSGSGEILPTVFIRFNPDAWKDEEGVSRKVPMESRLEDLDKEIKRWMNPDRIQEHYVQVKVSYQLAERLQVVYLYYDGPKRRLDFVPVSPEETFYEGDVRTSI